MDKPKDTYKEITEARKILEIPERATISEIKSSHRRLISRWHPDTCTEDPETCTEMTRKINAAYTRIMAYCDNYQFSFSKEEVKNYLSPEEWWLERFGIDPLWGREKQDKS